MEQQDIKTKSEDSGVRWAFEKLEMAWPGPPTKANCLQFAEYLRQQATEIEAMDFKKLGMRDA